MSTTRRSDIEPRSAAMHLREQLLLTAAALSSGTALVVAIEAKVNLGLLLLLLGAMSGTVFRLRWIRSDDTQRTVIRASIYCGLVAGTLATLGYDLSRLLIVTIARMKFWPFHAFSRFGELILGSSASPWAAWTVGTAYHYLNGVAFAVGYCFLLGGRNWKWGVVWGLSLEAAMFTIYPGWLDLNAVMAEFTIVSISGHLVYGAVLGVSASRLVQTSSEPNQSPLPKSIRTS